MLNLTEIAPRYLEKYSDEQLGQVIGKEPHIVKRWRMSGVYPALVDLQKVVEFDPSLVGPEDDPIGDIGAPAQTKDEIIAEYQKTPEALEFVLQCAREGRAPAGPLGPMGDPEGEKGVEGPTGMVGHYAPGVEVRDPDPTQYDWPEGNQIALLMPSNRNPDWAIVKTFAAIFEREKMRLIHPGVPMSGVITRNRNQMAQDFLNSGLPIAVMWDDDTIPPSGDVQFYRFLSGNPAYPEQYAKLHPIGRLLQSKKTLIGGVYFSRRSGGRAQYHGAFASNQANDVAHNGPRNLVEKQNWVGLGFTLIRREVFTDIIRSQPQIEMKDQATINQLGYRYRFFNPLSIDGPDSEYSEDVAFCTRALRAGHQPYVDHALSMVHLGDHGFAYHNTRRTVLPLQ